MAITSSAKKAIRVAERKRVFNLRCSRAMKQSIKEVLAAHKEGDKTKARKLFTTAQKTIDKAEKRGIIKPNTANRKKSRLSKAIR